MAEFGRQETLTLEAAADLSTKQHHLVRLSGANLCNQASEAVNAGLIGVLQNKPKSGEFATVAYQGQSKVVAGAAITAGARITTNGSGRAVATSALSQMVIGQALEAAGANGEVISALILGPSRA
jgi:hypothetical protein